MKKDLANTFKKMGHFFNMATIQEEATMKKIMRRAHLSTVMSMCRCSDM